MSNEALIVARKEMLDSIRDVRAVFSSLLYVLMGPLVVGLVSLAPGIRGNTPSPLPALMSVFALVTAFSGGMNIAVDTIAGERERRSLLPLLLNPVPRRDIAFGKYLAIGVFALAGQLLNLMAFAAIARPHFGLAMVFAILPLPLLAAAVQMSLAMSCRAIKEAHTYLSMLVFLPMAIGMFLVFFPAAQRAWFWFVPLFGQQLSLGRLMEGQDVPLLPSIVLGCCTLVLAFGLTLLSSRRLQRDEIIYGN